MTWGDKQSGIRHNGSLQTCISGHWIITGWWQINVSSWVRFPHLPADEPCTDRSQHVLRNTSLESSWFTNQNLVLGWWRKMHRYTSSMFDSKRNKLSVSTNCRSLLRIMEDSEEWFADISYYQGLERDWCLMQVSLIINIQGICLVIDLLNWPTILPYK